MKASFKKSDIIPALERAVSIAGKRTNFAISQCILLEASNEGLTLTANNLDASYQTSVKAAVTEPGEIAIDAKRFHDIMKTGPDGGIQMHDVENRWIEITFSTGKAEFHVVSLDPEEFPDSTELAETPVPVSAALLGRELSRACLISPPPDDNRAHIQGVCLDWTGREGAEKGKEPLLPGGEKPETPMMSVQSTDGARLSAGFVPCPNDPHVGGQYPWILAKDSASTLARMLEGREGNCQLAIGDRHMFVEIDGEKFGARLLEGDWPTCAAIMGIEMDKAVEIASGPLVECCRRMGIMATEKYKGTIWDFDDGRLTVAATNPDLGESREELAVEYDGEAVETGLNQTFVQAAVKACGGETVKIEFADSSRPFRFINPARPADFTCLIMPMQI